jgi:hypothetical protein
MNKLIFFLLFILTFNINPQAYLIQSIDFDSQGRTIYAFTGNYDSSYVMRFKNGILEKWNLSEIFSLPFYWISSSIDKLDNIWTFIQNKLYKFDGFSWSELDIPNSAVTYQKYSDIAIDDEYLWLSLWHSGVYTDTSLYKLKLSDTTWSVFSSTNSGFPKNPQSGIIFLKGDSTFIGTTKGLVMVHNDSARVILDTTNSNLATQNIYCLYIDSGGNKWLGTMNNGLVKWIDNSTFVTYNASNSNLKNNFINAIAEDSYGTLWLATDNGFASFNGDSITAYNHLLDNTSVITLAVDQYDKVWLGTIGKDAPYVYDGNSLYLVTDIMEEQKQPKQFGLYQNYPNPFNPMTKIKYSVMRPGTVYIKVYGVLGTEIKILVNEYKQAGTYEIEFDASSLDGLPSGVYFYKMISEGHSETKKMLLVR